MVLINLQNQTKLNFEAAKNTLDLIRRNLTIQSLLEALNWRGEDSLKLDTRFSKTENKIWGVGWTHLEAYQAYQTYIEHTQHTSEKCQADKLHTVIFFSSSRASAKF